MEGAYIALRIRENINKLRSSPVKYQEDRIDDIEMLVDPSTTVSTIDDEGLKSEIKELVSLASRIITSIICMDGPSEIKNRAISLAENIRVKVKEKEKNIRVQKKYQKMDPEETDVSSTGMPNKYGLYMLLMLIRGLNDLEKDRLPEQLSDDVASVACMLRSLRLSLALVELPYDPIIDLINCELVEELEQLLDTPPDRNQLIIRDYLRGYVRSFMDRKHPHSDILKLAIMSWSYPEIEMFGHKTVHKSIGNLNIPSQPETFASEHKNPTNTEININEIRSNIDRYLPHDTLIMKMIVGLLGVNPDVRNKISAKISELTKYTLEDRMFKVKLLQLCYSQMPAPVCCCFIYCSMFPKDWIFEPEKMIQLWTSEGFILTNNEKEKTEDVGRRYFNELVSRSFFEPLPVDGNTSYYTMHPTVHRFAQDLWGEQFLRIDRNNFDTPNLLRRRHLSITTDQLRILGEQFLSFYGLRTLIILGPSRTDDGIILKDAISKLHLIRTLYLEGCVISEFPETLFPLLHLRYLNLSDTGIHNLPKNFNEFHSLEVLKLEEFRVGNEKEHDISQLGDLSMLRGSLSITNLENVLNDEEAAKARLSEKSGLTSLKLEWSSETETNCNTVNQLKPPISIKVIELKGYPCPYSPDWLENNWLENVVEVSLTDCMNLVSLPPLGSLAHLRILKLYNLPSVKPNVPLLKGNSDDRRSTDDAIGFFKSLEELFVEHIPEANEIVTNNYRKCFPRLRRFLVRDCSSLKLIPQICSPMLTEVVMERTGLTSLPFNISGPLEESRDSTFSIEVIECPDIRSIDGDLNIKSVTKLVLQKCPELMTIAPAVFSGLVFLELIGCDKLEVALDMKSTGRLKELRIQGCPKITIQCSKEEDNGKQSTSSLSILHTDNISIISELLKTAPLRVLTIEECSQLDSLNILMIKGSSVLEKLQQLCLTSCENLKALPRNMKAFSSLERLFLKDCAKIGSLPVLPTSLEQLQIIDCPILEERCQEDGPDWTKISHIPYKLIE